MARPKIAQVNIGGTGNRGDGLMLLAAADQMRARGFLVAERADLQARSTPLPAADVRSLPAPRLRRHPADTATALLTAAWPARMQRRYGLVGERAVSCVLDASGYAYGDPWPEQRALNLLHTVTRLKRSGVPLVLLPQSFGPFERPEIAVPMREALAQVALVCTRDAASADHVRSLGGAAARHLLSSVDFTPLVGSTRLPQHAHLAGRACIVPSLKMTNAVDADRSRRYPSLLAELWTLWREAGLEPFFLIHRDGDEGTLEPVRTALGHDVEVVSHPDPRVLKGVLGAAAVVVSSRFHALVSTLSQGVPALATSWTHKFDSVMEQYGSAERLIDPIADPAAVRAQCAPLLTPAGRVTAAAALAGPAARHRDDVEAMWAQVHVAVGT